MKHQAEFAEFAKKIAANIEKLQNGKYMRIYVLLWCPWLAEHKSFVKADAKAYAMMFKVRKFGIEKFLKDYEKSIDGIKRKSILAKFAKEFVEKI